MDEGIIRDIERFLYREARLLDERRFREWLELFTDDVVRHHGSPRPFAISCAQRR